MEYLFTDNGVEALDLIRYLKRVSWPRGWNHPRKEVGGVPGEGRRPRAGRSRSGIAAIEALLRQSDKRRQFHPRRRLRRGRQRGERSFQLHSTPPPSMREGGWCDSGAPEDLSDLLDIAVPTLTETVPPSRGERQDKGGSRWLPSAGLDLPPVVVHRHPDHIPPRRRLLLFRRAQA